MIHKLRQKFIVITMLSVTIVMLFLGVAINVLNFISTNSDLKSTLEMIYENQGAVPQFPAGNKPVSPRKDHFTVETPYSTRYFVLKYDADGSLDSANMKHIAAVTEADAEKYLKIAEKHGEGFGFAENYKFYVVKTGPDKFMAIFLDCYDEFRLLRSLALVSVMVIVCCIALVLVLVLLLSRRAITPTIQAIEKQKQFITDASHELKTPLTVITTSLKVLEMDMGENKWSDKIRGQTDKLARLVDHLVTLSRLDEEHPPLQVNDFPISAAVAEVADSFRDYAAAQGHRLETEIAADLRYLGDEYAIRQLTSILMDNAVKYADPAGAIWIRLKKEKKGVSLQTENLCASFNSDEAGKLFDRFYRADKSRSNQTAGFGIGLSIARSIAEAHRGTIKAEYTENGMIRFLVRLP